MSKAVIMPECGSDLGTMKEELSISPSEKKDVGMGLFSRLLRFDSLSKKNVPESPTNPEPPATYYGVYIPCEIKKGPDEEALHVYKNKSEALELVRRYKLSRFKAFNNRQDAVSFALRGAEPVDTTDGNENSLMGEKPYPFKAPSPQDMVALRKSIEAGLAATVRDRVWDNPRYLVSSGNTPAIMQEGSRYNALHIAAKAMNAELCNLILNTVGNPAFVQRLYGADAHPDCCKEFAGILLDRYLNTPDKALNETPLHFAAKYGAPDAVDVITSFPQCNTAAVNKYGEQPKDIICKRAPNATGECAKRIACLLRERYYVPVLHCEDGSAAPTIGAPFTPKHPPEINVDPLSPRYEIRAFAGPMEAAAADSFRRRWKTPPRSARPAAFRLKEITKGLENVGRNLAEQMQVGWKEYWPFLDTFTDLRTAEGLDLLEKYLKSKYESACSLAYSDSMHHSPAPSALSALPARLSLSLSTASASDGDTMSPITELCVAMKTCKISTDRPPHARKTDPLRQRMCRQPSVKVNGDATPPASTPTSTPANHSVSQLLCIERTCQVFATRIADALHFSLAAEPEVAGESLRSEATHLHHTIRTYMEDERFHTIEFALVHSRLAQLAVHKLKQQTQERDDMDTLAESLARLRCHSDDALSSDEERKPSYRSGGRMRVSHVIDAHVRCLAGLIGEELAEESAGGAGPAGSEAQCAELWRRAVRCRCDWRADTFERNHKKNASLRKNRSILSTSPKGESFIRRLVFDHDIGDGALHAGAGAGGGASVGAASVNSPAGDSAPALYTIDTRKCHVVQAEMSEDESVGSCSDEEYETASAHSSDDERMHDASDTAIAEPFIYGEEPSKMDRLVFEALSSVAISAAQYPHVYRWRHTVALYSPNERDTWTGTCPETGSPCSPSSPCPSTPCGVSTPCGPLTPGGAGTPYMPLTPGGAGTPRRRPARCSTPNRDIRDDSTLPLQVSNWLRVTGPNSPRSSLASKTVNHNVSFGY